ncbi:hypothetical protein ACWD4V_31800 [Streptomyces tsukubensis]|uniref:hypothetical protein n=1 Tax=Streptomyces tsukubensis TaxID=83656 RepID=UPI0036B6CDBD
MRRFRTPARAAVAAVAALVCAAPSAPAAAEDGWLPTGPGITAGISGLAAATPAAGGTADLLAVHDNKKAGEPRVSRIRIEPGGAPAVRGLQWRGPRLPVDLEALSEVPGQPGEFVALESSGRGYHLRLQPDAVRVVREFTVPDAASGENYEGFELTRRSGRLVAVWAHRGQDGDPAVVRLARLDWRTLVFGPRRSAAVTVPYPAERVRHISAAEVTASGRLITTAASDPGDDGPFRSAVYDLGRVVLRADGEPGLEQRARPLRLGVFGGHKAEALACTAEAPGSVLGSDDENLGGWVRRDGLCGPGTAG